MERPTIALQLPYSDDQDRYFALRLKRELQNEPAEYGDVRKIFVISDLQGNFRALRRLLVKNRVIDQQYNWIFEDGHLVVLGNCFNYEEHITECLWLIYGLEENAIRAGGYVHYILGSQEVTHLNENWRQIYPRYANSEKSPHTPFTVLYDGSNELWRWLLTKNIVERIGDSLFVHAGISAEVNRLDLSITGINEVMRPYYTMANNSFADSTLSIVFDKIKAPFWYQGYYQQADDEKQVDETLLQFGIKTIITGHTIVDHVTALFNGKVINVDTNHAAGVSEALLIKNNHFYRVDTAGNRERLK